MAFLLFLQGLELFVNALRSYSTPSTKWTQEAIDLQGASPHPDAPNPSGLNGLGKMLFAQSVGLAGTTSGRGVISRMMPRAIIAMIVIALFAGSVAVVRLGEVAVPRNASAPPTSSKTPTAR